MVLRLLLFVLATGMMLVPAPQASAQSLPDGLSGTESSRLMPVGSGTYRKLGFTVYRATLWAPKGRWTPGKPYALQLRYVRSLSKTALVSAVRDDMRHQGADHMTARRWERQLEQSMPSLKEGDEVVGLALPDMEARFYLNGRQIAHVNEPAFVQAFFDIWLGDRADATLRAQLLGREG